MAGVCRVPSPVFQSVLQLQLLERRLQHVWGPKRRWLVVTQDDRDVAQQHLRVRQAPTELPGICTAQPIMEQSRAALPAAKTLAG